MGIPFVLDPADIVEEIAPGESAERAASRLAAEKAAAVAARRPDSWILAADTLVLREGRILGKPRGDADAATMLRFLAGFEHRVVTAVRLARGEEPGQEVVETTAVRIAPLTEEEILWYVATGEPRDKAGAYAIQGYASRFVTRIDGSYSNVVGLPVALVTEMFKAAGFRP
jgi:septum formation protein